MKISMVTVVEVSELLGSTLDDINGLLITHANFEATSFEVGNTRTDVESLERLLADHEFESPKGKEEAWKAMVEAHRTCLMNDVEEVVFCR